MSTKPAPILKWAGGKTQLLHEILPRLPQNIRTYYEPFIGGGAVFWALASEGRFEKAVISDANRELVELYTVVRDQPHELLEKLAEHEPHKLDPDYFYALRAERPQSVVGRSARMVFLNKTCFNGLYRVNRSGGFNVPFGKYKNPNVRNEDLILACSKALAWVTILHGDFERAGEGAREGDAFFYDPPYVPLNAQSFTTYTKDGFSGEQQLRVAQLCKEHYRYGRVALLSNSDCEYTQKLYTSLRLDYIQVKASRNINSKGSKRGKITELLVYGG